MKIHAAILICLLAAFTPLTARTLTMASEGFSITVPDDWNQPSTDGAFALLFAQDPTRTSFVRILVTSYNGAFAPDAASIAAFEEKMIAASAKGGLTLTIESTKPVTIDGISTYEIRSKEATSSGKSHYMLTYPIVANGKTYMVWLQTIPADKLTALRPIAQSFHFTVQPDVPPQRPLSKREIAYKFLAVLGVVAGVGVVLCILYVFNRRRLRDQ